MKFKSPAFFRKKTMTNEINILFLGDMVGRPGRTIVKKYLSEVLGASNAPDFVIANVENASHGFGLTEKTFLNI